MEINENLSENVAAPMAKTKSQNDRVSNMFAFSSFEINICESSHNSGKCRDEESKVVWGIFKQEGDYGRSTIG